MNCSAALECEAIDTAATRQSESAAPRWPSVVKGVCALVIIASLLLMISALPVEGLVERLSIWIDGLGAAGYLIFALIYFVCVVLMLPGAVVTLAAGVIFGVVKGSIIVSLASTSGVAATFLIGRYFARNKIAAWIRKNKKTAAIDRAIGEKGWRIVLLMRLSPAVPFNLQNYLYGVTSIRFWPCVLASWIGMAPGTIMYVYLGTVFGLAAGAAAGDRAKTPGEWVLIIVGLLATVLVTVYITRIATRALKEYTQDEPADAAPKTSAPADHSSKNVWIAAFIAVFMLAGAVVAKMNQDVLAKKFVIAKETYADSDQVQAKQAGFDHSLFDQVVKEHVDADGWVNYSAMSKNTEKLDAYMASLAAAPFDELSRDEKLTLLINAYNAFTLRLILDHWDDGKLQSINDIPASKRWKATRWTLAGETVSLNDIEHKRIRPNFKEPRIHFALVCAAVGCPKLRNDAYLAGRLDAQLDDQMRYSHTHDRWFRYDVKANHLELTKLYKWYGDDFKQQAGSVLNYVSSYSDELKKAIESGESPRVRYLDYSWKLNRIENRP